MSNLEFYKGFQQLGLKLITKYGDTCKVTATDVVTNNITNQQSIREVFSKDVLYVAKVIKNTLIQDRFYETAEVSIILPFNSFELVDRYKYRVKFHGADYEVIRHRSIRPGPLEVLIELALRKSGTGERK